MGKRAGGSGDFVMAKEIRNLLTENRNLTGREVLDLLKERFPKQPINENSCSVAFTNARTQMGISSVRRKRPGKKASKQRPRAAGKASAASSETGTGIPSMELLLAAKQLLQQCQGDATAAASALKHVAALQMK